MEREREKELLERYESCRGRTTPEIEWRVWNNDHTMYRSFKRKKDAIEYLRATE